MTVVVEQDIQTIDFDFIVSVFKEKGVDLKAPVVATCWIGMTACSLSLALNHVGVRDVSVYTVSPPIMYITGEIEI